MGPFAGASRNWRLKPNQAEVVQLENQVGNRGTLVR
jgi:hypothetical protein